MGPSKNKPYGLKATVMVVSIWDIEVPMHLKIIDLTEVHFQILAKTKMPVISRRSMAPRARALFQLERGNSGSRPG